MSELQKFYQDIKKELVLDFYNISNTDLEKLDLSKCDTLEGAYIYAGLMCNGNIDRIIDEVAIKYNLEVKEFDFCQETNSVEEIIWAGDEDD